MIAERPPLQFRATPKQPHAAKLLHRLQSLRVVGRVLYVAAHPDDENTRLLSYLVGDRKVTAAYLSLTRGDGGQNRIGSEQSALLGVVRTQELLQARRVDGALQFFTRAKDFGYSKSAAESIRIWDRETVLGDVVWVIRLFRPDVIITRFPERGRSHGHHLASAQLARAAFTAAADPTKFSSQLSWVKPWKTKRLLYNVARWYRRPGEDLSRYLKVDVGGFNPLLGRSYGEIAAKSRTMHKSQGFGSAPRRGPVLEYFQHLAGKKASGDFLSGLHWSWTRIPGGEEVDKHLKAAIQAFSLTAPEKSVPSLLRALQVMKTLKHPLVAQKRLRLEEVVAQCLGLVLELKSRTPRAVIASSVSATARVLLRQKFGVVLDSIEWNTGKKSQVGKTLAPHRFWTQTQSLIVPVSQPISAPHWLATKSSEDGSYEAKTQRMHLPVERAPLGATFVLKIGKQKLRFWRGLRYVWTDRVRGQLSHRVEVVPDITVTPLSDVQLFPRGRAQQVTVEIRASGPTTHALLRLRVPPAWRVRPLFVDINAKKAGERRRYTFTVTPPVNTSKIGCGYLEVTYRGSTVSWREDTIKYKHFPKQTILRPASVKLVPLTVQAPSGKIAYIPGSGDKIPQSLRLVGADVVIVDTKTLAVLNLKRFRTIVLGVRALNLKDAVRRAFPRLLTWVQEGGTLVVQYNKNNRWNPIRGPVGPYPITIGRTRVTNESAAVRFLHPKHPLMNVPHRITEADFQGWVQERGLYFPVRWDTRYTSMLGMADPGEGEARGSLLLSHYGKGAFIYTSLSFFRQLPAGVPGAYRLLLNLIQYRQPSKASKPK